MATVEAASTPSTAADIVVDSSEWVCPQCTLFNPPLAPICGVCEYLRCSPGAAEGEARHDQAAVPRREQAATTTARMAVGKRRRTGEQSLASMWGVR